jgi:hypothetical protein
MRTGEENALMPLEDLRQSPTMVNLLDALDRGEDIGHRGRFTFAAVAARFLPKEEVVAWLEKGSGGGEHEAKALVQQVTERGYNPPSRQRLLDYNKEQAFQICPTPDDPDTCNLYRELTMPEEVIEDIEEYREQQFEAEEQGEAAPAR